MVVQPGVEFDHDSVIQYQRSKATALIEWRQQHASEIVFEAHSTDYQLDHSYKELVEDGFAILKVGPALTFALREALDALASIETLLITPEQQSRLLETIEQTMVAHPAAWAAVLRRGREGAGAASTLQLQRPNPILLALSRDRGGRESTH